MISWAQNAEDVVLARALPGDRGFYVDVGAADPVIASVTKHFYDNGWSGINIDPRPDAIERLGEARPRDLNLQLAISDRSGTATFQINEDDRDQSYLGEPGAATTSIEVATQTLDSVLADAGVTTVDFVKVDVEGAEESVLRGFDLRRWRPRVLVIEAIAPWSHRRVEQSWRHLVEDAGYREASFDGINLFFAHESEQAEFFELLAPASVLDDYRPQSWQLLHERVEHLEIAYAAVELLSEERSRVLADTAAYARSLELALSAPAASNDAAPRRTPRRYRRVAVVGPSNSIARAAASTLSAALNAPLLKPRHPGEIPWDALPERVVFLMSTPMSPALQDRLIGAAIVPTAVDPSADLAVALHAQADSPLRVVDWLATDEAMALWGDLQRWWSWPRTVRFAELTGLLDLIGPWQAPSTADLAVSEGDRRAIEHVVGKIH